MKPATHFICIASLFLLITFTGCRKGNILGIIGKGSNVSETRDVRGFDRINLKSNGDVIYLQDSLYFVEVSGQKNILDVLETRNEGGTLVIDFRRNVWKHNHLTITVHSPSISAMSISGSGNFQGKNTIITNAMEFNVSGSGNITLDGISATTLVSKISGSGNVLVNGGTVTSQNLSISGSGNMNLLEMTSSNCSCKISGSGDLTVNVLETLDVSISGSGNVKYKGTPGINSQISGSGKLRRI